MYRVSASTEISAPPALVWDMLCDPHRYPELIDATERMVEVPDPPMQVGYTYREYAGMGPFKSESSWAVTEFQPYVRQVHEGDDGAMRFRLEIEIEPSTDGCRLTHRFGIEPSGMVKVANLVFWPLFMRRATEKSLERTMTIVRTAAESSIS